jgi:hypothetical protein
MNVRCKFRCHNRLREPNGWCYMFHPVYEGSEENKRFFQATPYGSLTIGAMQEGLFEIGQEYYLDLSPAQVWNATA